MNNREIIGHILILSPLILVMGIPLIFFISSWLDAINDYKEYGIKNSLIMHSVITIIFIMFLIGLYLINTK